MPAIHACLDAEESHRLSVWFAKHGLVPSENKMGRGSGVEGGQMLETKVWGKTFDNPIGIAAGYDKHAEAIDALFGFGFGLVEIGSVTPKPQSGNPKPRMFRLPKDTAVINRYGFNSDGHQTVLSRLSSRVRHFLYRNRATLATSTTSTTSTTQPPAISASVQDGLENTPVYGAIATLPVSINRSLHANRLLGINLGKNKTSEPDDNSDYTSGVTSLGPYADYIVVNVSSPNTPGLRALQRRETMATLMQEVKKARDTSVPHRPPVLVKIAPDVSDVELEDIATVVESVGVDGIIISNTTISRPDSLKSDPSLSREVGGLSGPPVLPLALSRVSHFYRLTQGRVPIIGCGGVTRAEDVLAFGKAGASLVQVYTGFGYHGPGMPYDLKVGLVELLKKEGKTWGEIVGASYYKETRTSPYYTINYLFVSSFPPAESGRLPSNQVR